MKKSIEGRIPGHLVDKIKAMAIDLAQQGEDEPMDKTIEIVIAAGLTHTAEPVVFAKNIQHDIEPICMECMCLDEREDNDTPQDHDGYCPVYLYDYLGRVAAKEI